LRELLLEVAALRSLLDERAELEHDRPARREVAGRLIEAQQALAYVIAETYGGGHSRWFYRREPTSAANARQIDELLSKAADITYPQTPHVWNELIVRRQLSSAAAKARRNLIEALLNHADKENLGLVGFPPERAIYESVLHAGGLHRQHANGSWQIGPPPPDDPLKLGPVWTAMEQHLATNSAEPQPLTQIFAALEGPPFGVKAGLTPLLFVTLYVARAGEMNLYERGSYVPDPDIATFERLLARPEPFAVRLSRADGVRRLVYERLAERLAPGALSRPVQPALLAVALPLLRRLHHLPAFSKQTRRVSQRAQDLRRALREARAPDELLFERLPAACGMPPFQGDEPENNERVDSFATALDTGMHELQQAYSQLVQQIAAHISAAFSLQASGLAARAELQKRQAMIAERTNDSTLRALGVRLETANPEGDAWVESLAALVAKRPPEQWSDSDLTAFADAIAQLGQRLRAAEELAVIAQTIPTEAKLLRIGLANGHGELSRVLHLENNPEVQQLRDELNAALGRHMKLTADQRAAALAELLQTLLGEGNL
ncbi:MAG: hypothetical protein HGA19_05410, partial [Oscillochloris sp.]|nr:hypothetical protein [Oscillochloris sp.]